MFSNGIERLDKTANKTIRSENFGSSREETVPRQLRKKARNFEILNPRPLEVANRWRNQGEYVNTAQTGSKWRKFQEIGRARAG